MADGRQDGMVGVGRFELPTSRSRTVRSNQAELHPVRYESPCRGGTMITEAPLPVEVKARMDRAPTGRP